jgi:beta-lactamase class A
MPLKEEIQSVIAASEAEMGVAVHHLESGEECHVNADHPFPMASVFKIPILAEAFRQLRQGHFQLADRWTLSEAHKNRGSGILPFFEAGLTPTVRDLLTLMIIISDNTATDLIVHRLGGPAAVEGTMHQLGLTNIHFKLTVKDLLDDCLPPAEAEADDEQVKARYPTGFKRDSLAFSPGPENNVSTPRDMTRLLCMIFRGEIVDREACDQMLDILLQQQFNVRLTRFLPRGTQCAHKTGTLGGVRNDSGIIYINEGSHAAVTLFTRWDDEAVWADPVATQERIFAVESAMGRIGRLVYDYFKS